MTEHKPPRASAPSTAHAFARMHFYAAFVCALVALALCVAVAHTSAQSGRKGAKPASSPTPEASPQGESESKPKAEKPSGVVISFIVIQMENAVLDIDMNARDDVRDTFFKRLGQPRAVSVSDGGKGGRKEARERAKKEETGAYVVLFELEEERAAMGEASIGGRVDSRTLLIKTYVYAPKTADIKYTDVTMQRPYRDTTTVGGVRIPIPSRRIEQYPSQLQLEQAARDAADKMMSHFGIMPPRDN
jgi:hypothetical protein